LLLAAVKGKETFSDLKMTRQYLNALEALNFSEPTAIQRKAIPVILAGQDVIGVAKTGSGKTAAYLLPVFKQLQFAKGDSIRALVMVPTKELAIQVFQMAKDLARYTDLRVLAIYGGVGWKQQAEQLEKGIDVLVATPGRFKDLYFKKYIPTKHIRFLVLDEADRLMDMGFMHQLRDLLEVIPRKRQNLLFSATFNSKVEHLSHEFLEFPVRIQVDEKAVPLDHIAQWAYSTENERTKIEVCYSLLKDRTAYTRVLVFIRSKKTVSNVAKYLERKLEEPIGVIHSNKGQHKRIAAMEAFKEGEIRVLLATDVASRGIDALKVSHIINFDVPHNPEDFMHRIGRTARARERGVALTLVNKAEQHLLRVIEESLGFKLEVRALPAEIPVFETSPEEQKSIAMELDRQKRMMNRDYMGAFHSKKSTKK
jgi:ATP-dependent RNA helicase RhlE